MHRRQLLRQATCLGAVHRLMVPASPLLASLAHAQGLGTPGAPATAASPSTAAGPAAAAAHPPAGIRAAATGVAGAALARPTGPVLLSVSGRIGLGNQAAGAAPSAQFDMAMLEHLPQVTLQTQTPWYREPRAFTGPLLRELLARVQAQGSVLRAVALNDYTVEIPVDDVRRYDVVLARLMDDKPMPVRDKGPLFIIYPFDRHAELRNAVYFSRCAWQLKALEVV